MAQVRTRSYRNGRVDSEDFPVAAVSDHLAQSESMVWIDMFEPSAAELHELADELGLHELAIEDALGEHQRPKIDHYGTHLFLACHAVAVDPSGSGLIDMEVDTFIGDRWLITVRKDERFDMDAVVARWDRSSDLSAGGVSFLLYGLLDVVVDCYFDTVEQFDNYYDMVSEGIFADTPLEPSQQRDWFEMRRALTRFHRLVVPLREAVSGLMRREHGAVADDLYPYYQDVYDHILRVGESTDSLRELVSTIVETNLSLRDYRQNLIMKKVTSWAAIIAVPTLITGIYGMNVPFPGNGRSWGVVVALALVVMCSATLYGVFRRKDWL